VAEVRGHAPREAGAKLVSARGTVGQRRRRQNCEADGRGPCQGDDRVRGSRAADARGRVNPHARNEHGRQC